MKFKALFITIFTILSFNLISQNSVLENNFKNNLNHDEITRSYVNPVKIVWQSDNQNVNIKNSAVLLKDFNGQLSTSGEGMCVLRSDSENQASILLDYGKELYGGIQLAAGIRGEKKPIKIRVRFGESVSEAMSETGAVVSGMNSATNDHSLRDFTLEVPWLGTIEIGNSGYRFVRIDLLDKDVDLPLQSVRAIFRYRDIPYLGTFKCDDERLNKIWETGAYTVHLNMQEYLWDGIKRDRLVWVGDMHPEVATINRVFGQNDVINKSLDFARDTTPLPGWMNSMTTYSMWWIIIHRDLYLHQGDISYLKEQHTYLTALIQQITSQIDKNGKENLNGTRFLDWPTSEDPDVIHSGIQALTVLTIQAGKDIAKWLKDPSLEKTCDDALTLLKKYIPEDHNNKQAAALLSLANITTPQAGSSVILDNGSQNFATFYGYYMLEALAKDGKYKEAMQIISDYWGAMLDLGATTFWENFIYEERTNATRIDQLPKEELFDIHADGGAFCYVGLRASLCHGWASGPTSWLTEHVLGIKVLEPGSKTIQIKPHLGDLKYAEGTFPTPFGIVKVKHTKQVDGRIKSEINAPKGVKIIK
ncbi:MAG: alpha-L-rhamnosidase C-terminal domain-containing protein [Dysgonamonadaceae bacterium]|nr:alpha-L-rhamnosidase C-terminal domain-containing protein [Dysgonamonadaceae bacterium]